jgi:hypothetical protein
MAFVSPFPTKKARKLSVFQEHHEAMMTLVQNDAVGNPLRLHQREALRFIHDWFGEESQDKDETF